MAHRTARYSYARLTDRLNRFPQGATHEELLYPILRMLFSEREAELVALVPIKPFTAAQAARIWKMSRTGAQMILEQPAGRQMKPRCLEALVRRFASRRGIKTEETVHVEPGGMTWKSR